RDVCVRAWKGAHDEGSLRTTEMVAAGDGAGSGGARAGHRARRLLLFLGEGQGHSTTGAEGVYHLGPGGESRVLHGPAEVRGQCSPFRHADSAAVEAQAGRDAARFLQGTPRLFHPQKTPATRIQAAANARVTEGRCRAGGVVGWGRSGRPPNITPTER